MGKQLSTTQLAKLLGLTRVTISRAINNDPRVADKTRERVKKAMREHLMEPNAMARALATGRTGTIGLALGGDLQDNYAHDLMHGIEPILDETNLSVLIGVAQFDPEREQRELSAMLARRVEGILAQPLPENRSSYERLRKIGTPFVFLADYIDMKGASWVVSDAPHDARLAMEHLLGLGHRRIAYIGPKSRARQIVPRRTVYLDTLRAAGIAPDDANCFEGPLGDTQEVKQAVQRMMRSPSRPTAFFCAGDILAIHIMHQLRDDGFRIPEDVSLIGMGNTEMGHHCTPALTTIDENRIAIGKTACNILLDLIGKKVKRPQRVQLPSQLRRRESTAPPSA